jgi:predicted Fe-S protein YdhL (DUF1289 family)
MISPCKSICKLNSQRVCVGCFRTAAEITDWLRLPLEERKRIMKECKEREELYHERRNSKI